MSESHDVWVFIEQEEGQVAPVSLELLSKGQELARSLGGQVWAALLGWGVQSTAEQVLVQGVDRLLLAEHPELEHYRTLPYTRVLAEQAHRHRPHILLIGATPLGRDLAPRLASALKVGLTADCTDLQIGDYTIRKENRTVKNLLYQIRPAFGGNLIATITANIDLIGHFHVADVPGRNEPGSGEINYTNVFKAISETSYDRYVGLEFKPTGCHREALEAVKKLAGVA